jgi:hypothetical protein
VSDFEEAKWGIPYSKFERTSDGFVVEIESASPINPLRLLLSTTFGVGVTLCLMAFAIYLGFATNSFGVGIIGFLAAFVGGIWITVKAFVRKRTTKIVVTSDAILIDKKKLRRSDFIHFNISRTLSVPAVGLMENSTLATMGYGYGSEKFEFGGQLDADAATRIISSLNTLLRATPQEGDELSPSPEALRAARPTDF